MSAMDGGGEVRVVKKVMTQAISLLFDFLKNRERVEIWLYENTSMKIEGNIIGFDQFMNVVLDDAEEVYVKTNTRRKLTKLMLKGDCITLVRKAKSIAKTEGGKSGGGK
jgi:small nuclear ribonucleoprotein E